MQTHECVLALELENEAAGNVSFPGVILPLTFFSFTQPMCVSSFHSAAAAMPVRIFFLFFVSPLFLSFRALFPGRLQALGLLGAFLPNEACGGKLSHTSVVRQNNNKNRPSLPPSSLSRQPHFPLFSPLNPQLCPSCSRLLAPALPGRGPRQRSVFVAPPSRRFSNCLVWGPFAGIQTRAPSVTKHHGRRAHEMSFSPLSCCSRPTAASAASVDARRTLHDILFS